MNLDFVFICQSGELEIKASLLAASIRRFCDPDSNIHIIEPSPPEVYGKVSKEVKTFLANIGAKWYSFKNPISNEYKIGNKLNAFKSILIYSLEDLTRACLFETIFIRRIYICKD